MLNTNKYRSGTPLLKTYWENLLYHLRRLIYPRFHNGEDHAVLFYPDFPSKRTVLWKALNTKKVACTNNPGEDYSLSIFWQDETYRTPPPDLLKESESEVLNIDLTDISKHRVDAVFEEVFGYGTRIDPTRYKGKAVVKSNLNAAHDGREIECPITDDQMRDMGKEVIFQRVIDNTVENDMVLDLRLPVIMGEFPFLYKKYRPKSDRFSNKNSYSELVKVEDYLKTEELQGIQEFCKAIGLDYGEMDLLRDNQSGKIYIIDVNCTPWGPPNQLPNEMRKKAIELTGHHCLEILQQASATNSG